MRQFLKARLLRLRLAMTALTLIVFALLLGCEKPVAIPLQAPKVLVPIPARAVIAPIQIITTATIELPYSGQKIITSRLSGPMVKSIEAYIKGKGVFLDVLSISEETLPSSPSILELAQAGREKGADIVLVWKVTQMMGKGEFDLGFGQKLREKMAMELVIYEVATGARLYFRKEIVADLESDERIAWSDEKIENRYIYIAAEKVLPIILSAIIPKLHEDMASYKPPAIEKAAIAAAEFTTDVDRVPRVATEIKNNSFAVVVGIETYRDLPQAEFTLRDAKIMKEYLIRVMGLPEENIVTLLNERATKGDIEDYIGTWLKNNVDRSSSIFIYYGGHGAPNPVTGEAFIIPYDGNPAFPEATGIPLKKFYEMLAELQVKDTFVVMDSCFFGGGGRSVMAKGGRPMAISVENPVLATKNIVVMTAATGAEISSSYPEKRHGLFTYFF